jgi:hypothetical protein
MYASLHLCCVLLILGEWWSNFRAPLYSHTKILNSAQILGSFSIFFRTLLYTLIIISCFPLARRTLWLPTSHLVCLCAISYFRNPWVLNIVCLPSTNYRCFCVLHSTHFWEIHTLCLRDTYYIGLLSLSAHFGNRCQWGRSLEGLVWGGSCFGCVPKHEPTLLLLCMLRSCILIALHA